MATWGIVWSGGAAYSVSPEPKSRSATPRFEMRKEGLDLAIVDSHTRNFILTEGGIKPFDVHFEILNKESLESARLILE